VTISHNTFSGAYPGNTIHTFWFDLGNGNHINSQIVPEENWQKILENCIKEAKSPSSISKDRDAEANNFFAEEIEKRLKILQMLYRIP